MGNIWSALLHVRVFHVEIKQLGFFWQRAKYMYSIHIKYIRKGERKGKLVFLNIYIVIVQNVQSTCRASVLEEGWRQKFKFKLYFATLHYHV